MDDRRRQLERAASTGDLDARARLLTERLRAGDLPEDRLRLAAWLGDPAAGRALGKDALVPPTITVGRWVRGFVPWQETPWAREAFARTAAAAARVVLPCFDDPALPRRAVEALEAWIACPCEDHARDAAAAGSRVVPTPRGPAGLFAARGVRFAAPAVYRATTVALSEGPANATASEVATEAARATSPETVRGAIREALVPWALA